MYGTKGSLTNNRKNTTSSNIKQVTDNWYSKTMMIMKDSSNNLYNAYVSRTAIYCNDRSGDNYSANNSTIFASYDRLKNFNPSYKCGNNASRSLFGDANVADKFSASTTTGGNGQLQYPIAQITADELMFLGGRYNLYSKTWIYYNSIGQSITGTKGWWTMSPQNNEKYYDDSYEEWKFVIHMGKVLVDNTAGFLISSATLAKDPWFGWEGPAVRPVLSLKSCVKVTTGNGSSSTPYEVTIDSTCATAEN